MIKHKDGNIEINGKIFSKFLTSEKIYQIVLELANSINSDLDGKSPVFILVLNGSIFFGTDLLKKITLDCTIQTISAKSYGNDMKSSGKVLLEGLNLNITAKDVIIVEDIIDSGYTIKKIYEFLSTLNPASIKVVSLFSKPSRREVDIKIDYLGMEIPDKFVIGYGLDFAEKGRNLPDIYSLINDN